MALVVESYIARRTFTVGDRIVHAGDPVPEAERWRRPQTWVDSGYLAITYREVDPDADPVPEPELPERYGGSRQPFDYGSETGEDLGDFDLADLPVPDLRAIAKERGIDGYSKLKKNELIELLTAETDSDEDDVEDDESDEDPSE